MQKLIKITFLFIIVLIISIAFATFIENSDGADEAWKLIYDSVWFEVLSFSIVILLIANILKSQMYKKRNLLYLIFHFALIFIFIGAFIGKHYGFSGILHVSQNSSANVMESKYNYFIIKSKKADKTEELSFKGVNGFKKELSLFGKPLKITDKIIYKNAKKNLTM